MTDELDNPYQQFLEKVKVGIHEASDITGVPTRKIRYWQDKGYIQSTRDSGNTRQYDLFNVKKIVLIQELIEDGHTLDGAATKVNRRIEKLNKMFDLVLPTQSDDSD